VGQDDSKVRDAQGRLFSRTTVEMAQAYGHGWNDYAMVNPRTGQVEPKSMYFELVDNVVVGCGIYRTDAPAAMEPAARASEPAGYLESSWPRLGAT
jgi:hypothetical protein